MDENTLKERIREFTWYSPVDFGNGVIAARDFKTAGNIESIHFGSGKWKYIVERNLPDLQGKRVMDIGCNNGTSCIQMARMGAKEIFGIDSEKTWPNWMKQAQLVKEGLEWRCNTKYPITYIDSNMEKIPDLNLGRFDVVTALCCIYYLEDEKIHSLLRHFREHADFLLIQCNTRRQDQIPEVHRRAVPQYIENALKKAGFSYIDFDKPLFYERPVVVASRYPIKNKAPGGKIDRVRYWIRRMV